MKKQMKQKHDHSKLVWGLVIGAAVGVAIGGFMLYAKNNDISVLDEIEDAAKKAKKKVSKSIDEGLEELESASKKLTKSANEIVKKATE